MYDRELPKVIPNARWMCIRQSTGFDLYWFHGHILKYQVPNIELLYDQMQLCGKNHILQQNLFIILSSIEMIATSRLFVILNADVCMTVSWLAGHTHKLAHQTGVLAQLDVYLEFCTHQ